MQDFYHKKVIPFDSYLTVNFNYQDIDILLKSLELLSYNIKNVYLMKEDNASIKNMTYKISILHNLILSSYTLHIDNELKKKEEIEETNNKKIVYYRFKANTNKMRQAIRERKEREKIV